MVITNSQVLSQVTGELGVLEVINSGSCFELPRGTKEEIRDIQLIKKYFKPATVNVYVNNTTSIRQDPELVEWFVKESISPFAHTSVPIT